MRPPLRSRLRSARGRHPSGWALTGWYQLDVCTVSPSHTPSCTPPQEIAEHKGLPSFWVDTAARIDVANNTILHKLAHGELRETKNWLTPGKKVRA